MNEEMNMTSAEKLRKIISHYDMALQMSCPTVTTLRRCPMVDTGEDYSGERLYAVRLPGISREKLNRFAEKMAERGIVCKVPDKTKAMIAAYKAMGYDKEVFPEDIDFGDNEITLPLNINMTEDDAEHVISNFVDIVELRSSSVTINFVDSAVARQ